MQAKLFSWSCFVMVCSLMASKRGTASPKLISVTPFPLLKLNSPLPTPYQTKMFTSSFCNFFWIYQILSCCSGGGTCTLNFHNTNLAFDVNHLLTAYLPTSPIRSFLNDFFYLLYTEILKLKIKSNCTKLEFHNQVCIRYEIGMKTDHLKHLFHKINTLFYKR